MPSSFVTRWARICTLTSDWNRERVVACISFRVRQSSTRWRICQSSRLRILLTAARPMAAMSGVTSSHRRQRVQIPGRSVIMTIFWANRCSANQVRSSTATRPSISNSHCQKAALRVRRSATPQTVPSLLPAVPSIPPTSP